MRIDGTNMNKLEIVKRIIGFICLALAIYLTILFPYRTISNPNNLLKLKILLRGELGFLWTLLVVIFYTILYLIVFVLFRLGIKWSRIHRIKKDYFAFARNDERHCEEERRSNLKEITNTKKRPQRFSKPLRSEEYK